MSDFGDVYRRHAADVFRFALYLTGNYADAEDVTAETFARLWGSNAPIRAATLKAYLLTIARNVVRHTRRRDARRGELRPGVTDVGPGPHEQAAARGELRRVLRQLQGLPEIDRAALLLRAVADLSYEEIANALHISVASAKVKVHRARVALRSMTT